MSDVWILIAYSIVLKLSLYSASVIPFILSLSVWSGLPYTISAGEMVVNETGFVWMVCSMSLSCLCHFIHLLRMDCIHSSIDFLNCVYLDSSVVSRTLSVAIHRQYNKWDPFVFLPNASVSSKHSSGKGLAPCGTVCSLSFSICTRCTLLCDF